jgi:hypothetical protein
LGAMPLCASSGLSPRRSRAARHASAIALTAHLAVGPPAVWTCSEAYLRLPKSRTSGAPLTMTELSHVRELALGPAWEGPAHPNATPHEKPGSFRRHDIQPFPGGMTPPSWVEVPAEVTDWIGWLALIVSSDNVIERIAAAHGELERIHLFLDGNGRAGRLLTNLLLVRVGFPPAIIYTRDRGRYLRALQRAEGGEPGPLGEMIARDLLDNLYRFVVPAVAGRWQLVPLAALADKEHRVSTLRAA